MDFSYDFTNLHKKRYFFLSLLENHLFKFMEKNIEDTYLLTRIKAGDEGSFDTLFRKYYPALCAYGKKFIDLEDAEECAQETMLWLWENREALIIQTSLSSYLFTCIHHRIINKIHQREVKQRVETYFYEEMQYLINSDNLCLIKELTAHIHKAIEALPESYRNAFIMHRFKNMSYKEIAEALEISPKTVEYRIGQALKQLRIDLKDYLPLLPFLFYN